MICHLRKIAAFLLLMAPIVGYGQQMLLRPNAGQWDPAILYRTQANGGEIIFDDQGFLFHQFDASEFISHHHEGEVHEGEQHLRGHVVRMNLKDAAVLSSCQRQVNIKDRFYENYMLGNDSTKWVGGINRVGEVMIHDVYAGVDMRLIGMGDVYNYSFVLDSPSLLDKVVFEIQGTDDVRIDENGDLVISTPMGEVRHSAPKAFQMHWLSDSEFRREEIGVSFAYEDGQVRFILQGEADPELSLLIDPDLAFSTFSGSTSDNWGYTATPGPNGEAYGGGVVFGAGYPQAPGGYDQSYNGGMTSGGVSGIPGFDIGLMKFTPTGQAVYATYLGGALNNEAPFSMITDDNGDLYVMGATGSTDFPIIAGAYQSVHAGGPTSGAGNLTYGSPDMYIARLSSNGQTLVASTYLGGSGIDALGSSLSLMYNYGDENRGEIILDDQGDVVVASMTTSNDFPTTANAFDGTLSGTTDGVVCKLSPNLNNLLFSSYIGGGSDDGCFSIQATSTGMFAVCGGTTSTDFPVSAGAFNPNSSSDVDGWVSVVDMSLGQIVASTYTSVTNYDQNYFVQTDPDDFIYVYGQSIDGHPLTPGKYGNLNSGQYIIKFNTALTTKEWSTTIGGGWGWIEISPTAFLVSDCYDIYIAGWGGQVNQQNSDAVNSTTVNFPLTADAYQSQTGGSSFYMAVLAPDATSLKYATYMGGQSISFSAVHVDGGTSRFDKDGTVYHAVCGGCGGNNGFPTTPGAWSQTNNASNCNMAVFKFELKTIDAALSIGQPFVCLPDPVQFTNTSQNSNQYVWHFGDGTTSTAFEPSHLYPGPGTYTVSLVAIDSLGCHLGDSTTMEVVVTEFEGAVIYATDHTCPGDPIQLEAVGGDGVTWTPANLFSNANSAITEVTIWQDETIYAIISDSCGIDTVEVNLFVFGANVNAGPDTIICRGNSLDLSVGGGGTYAWSPQTDMTGSTTATPTVTPQNTITYHVEVTTPEGCVVNDSVHIQVDTLPPTPNIPDSIPICQGSAVTVTANGGTSFQWLPPAQESSPGSPTATLAPSATQEYYVDVSNTCGTVQDTVLVWVNIPNVQAFNDTTICFGETAELWATGAVSYDWNNDETHTYDMGDGRIGVSPPYAMEYTVIGIDSVGCPDTASVMVNFFPFPSLVVTPTVYAIEGDTVELWAEGDGNIWWTPSEWLSCPNCGTTWAFPPQSMVYTAHILDSNGCTNSFPVNIVYEGFIYVPNVFTPNGDGFNDLFRAFGGNLNYFEFLVFNRWGELIWEGNTLDAGWDGTYRGLNSPDGVYVWKIRYEDVNMTRRELIGHVTLLR